MKHKNAVLRRALTGLAALCLCAVLLFGTAVPAFAAGATVTIKVDDARLLKELAGGTNVSLRLYKIAGRNASGWNYAEAPAFAGLSSAINAYETALQNGTTPSLTVLSAITAVIAGGGVTPTPVPRSFSSGGSVTFDGLSVGLYFFVKASGPELLNIQSAIVPVPYTFKGAVLPSGIVTTAKVEWGTVPPYIPPTPPYTPPVNPNPPAPPVNPPVPQQGEIIIDDYDTPLGIAIETNHVGDCYE